MRLFAVDPGITTGWAILEDGQPTEMGEMQVTEFYDFLNTDSKWVDALPHYVIIEDYLIRPPEARGFDHSWSRAVPIQVIGAVQCWARRHHLPVELQQPSLLSPAAKRFNMRDPKNSKLPNRNAIAAILHARIFIEKLSVRQRAVGSLDEARLPQPVYPSAPNTTPKKRASGKRKLY